MMSSDMCYERFVQDGVAYINLYGTENDMICLREADWDLLCNEYGFGFDTPDLIEALRRFLRQGVVGHSRFYHEW